MNNEIVVDVFGPFACFTQPHTKVERVSYDVPTPSACRGILNAIYCKPVEFYYQITKIEVMNPIRLINIKRNGVNQKAEIGNVQKFLDIYKNIDEKKELLIQKNDQMSALSSDTESKVKKGLLKEVKKIEKDLECLKQNAVNAESKTDLVIDVSSDKVRTQRNTFYLKDVYYRIHAKMVVLPGCKSHINEQTVTTQFNQRVKNGKCFYQPFLGTRECMCFFQEPDVNRKPINENRELGIMLYDNFDIRSNIPLNTQDKTGSLTRSFYLPSLKNGIINVPDYESTSVLKGESYV